MTDAPHPGTSRRAILGLLGAAGAGLTGCLDRGNEGIEAASSPATETATEAATETRTANETTTDGSGAPDEETDDELDESSEVVRFALTPYTAGVDIERQYQPLFDHIESETDAVVEAERMGSQTETLRAVRAGRVDIADTSPFAAVAGADVADVLGVRVAFGAAYYFSLITTTPDSGVAELADLEGETVALGDPLSISGTLVPLVMLQNAGLDIGDAPDGDPVDFETSNSGHITARERMIERDDIAAAGTGAFSTVARVPQEQFDETSQEFADISAEYDRSGTEGPELRLLSVSDPLPRAPLVARSNWDADIRDDVAKAVLDADESDLAHDAGYDGEELWFDGLEAGSQADFEPIRRVMNVLDLDLNDLS
jgi:phosphonate transport system substrate-binding protein